MKVTMVTIKTLITITGLVLQVILTFLSVPTPIVQVVHH